MKTLLTAGLTLSGCIALRRHLNRNAPRDAEYAGGHIQVTELWNADGPFGLKVSRKDLLACSAAAMGALWLGRKRAPVAAGLVLGGGFSNLLERLRHQKVYDYVRFPEAPGKLKRYVFNLADFAIIAGCISLLAKKNR